MTQSMADKFNNTIGAVANLDFSSLYPHFQKSHIIYVPGLKVKKIQKILENINGLSQD
jgi:hypothetical protein